MESEAPSEKRGSLGRPGQRGKVVARPDLSFRVYWDVPSSVESGGTQASRDCGEEP